MEESNKDAELQQAKAEAELRKLNLEVAALQWQNSKLGRLSKFATVSAVLAAFITVLWGAYQLSGDRQKERDLRVKELRERTDNQFRSDLKQLLQYPTDVAQTKASTIFVLNDLANLIENEFQGKEQSDNQSRVGRLVQDIMDPVEFDAKKPRNIDFDRAALQCEYYKTFLRKNHRSNLFILTRYMETLDSLRKENMDFEQLKLLANSDWDARSIPAERFEKMKAVLPQFLDLIYAFQARVELLKDSSQDKARGADGMGEDLITALCYLQAGTNNLSVTSYAFGISEDEVKRLYAQCK